MDKDEIFDPGVDVAYHLETPDDARDLYAKWAQTYEAGFISTTQYVYHDGVARIFVDRARSHRGPVLDVGCGTGLVGEALRQHGVQIIDGIDISAEMLAVAAAKRIADGEPIYRSLLEADLTGPIGLESSLYVGIVSAGTFTHGHVGPDALDELIRVATPGCQFALGINTQAYEPEGFGDRFAAEVAAGTITAFDLVDIAIYDRTEGEHAGDRAQVAVFVKSH